MRWFIFPFCSFFIVLGSWIAWSAFKGLRKSYAVESWPTVDAEVISSTLEMNPNNDSCFLQVACEYQYMINGTKYVGTGVFPGYASSIDQPNRALNQALLNSRVVRVFYNADSPKESYLMGGPKGFHISSIFWGVLVICVGFFLLLTLHFAILDPAAYTSRLHIVK